MSVKRINLRKYITKNSNFVNVLLSRDLYNVKDILSGPSYDWIC